MSEYETDDDSSDVECPTCGRTDFKSVTGMRTHHTKAHGESVQDTVTCAWCDESKQVKSWRTDRSDHFFCGGECRSAWLSEHSTGEDNPSWNGGLATVNCAWCGESKQVKPSQVRRSERHFCNTECHGAWRSEHRSGKNGPRWNGGLVTVNCEWCGESKQVRPWNTRNYEHHFCDRECKGAWRSDHWTGENGPNWQGGQVTVECAWCGESKQVPPVHDRNREHHFCDDDCRGAWLSEYRSGENSYRWQGGEFLYGDGWNEAKKEKIRERQGRICANCGEPESTFSRKLAVHHIQKARSFDDPKQCNAPSNLVALCPSCHRTWEMMSPLRPETPYFE